MRQLALTVVFFTMVITLTGCGEQQPPSNTSSQTAPMTVTPPTTPPVKSNPVQIDSQLSAADIPKSPEEFRDTFVKLFEQNNHNAIRDLAYWGNLAPDVRNKNMEVLIKGQGWGDSKVTAATIEPCAADAFTESWNFAGPGAKPNLTPTHSLTLSTKTANGMGSADLTIPVGQHDGHFYFCVSAVP